MDSGLTGKAGAWSKAIDRQDLAAIALLLLLVLLLFWQTVVLGQAALPANTGRDALMSQYPLKLAAAQTIREGHLPLWDPYTYSGTPLLAAIIPMVFSLPDVIFYLFPTPLGYSYMLMLYVFLGGLFMYLLLRTLGAGRFGALTGAVVFMLNGYFLFHLQFRVFAPIVWLPLILLFAEKALAKSSYVYAALAGLACGMVVLSGHLHLAVLVLGAAVLYLLFRAFAIYRKAPQASRLARPLLGLVAMVVIGLGLGAVQLLPTLEFLPLSNRQLQAPYLGLNAWGNSTIGAFISLAANSFIPFFFGNGAEGVVMPSVPLLGIDPYPRYYAGILPLILASVAAIFRRDAYSYFFTFLACAVVAFNLVIYSPLQSLIMAVIPSFYWVVHEQSFFIYFTALAVLAGLGADYLLREGARQSFKRLIWVLAGLWGAAVAFFILLTALFTWGKDWLLGLGQSYIQSHGAVTPTYPHPLQYYYEKLDYYYSWFSSYFNISNPTVFVPLLVTGASIAAIALCYYVRPPRMALCGGLVLAVVFLDLFYVGTRFLPFTEPGRIYPMTPAISFLQERRTEELFRVVPAVIEEPALSGSLDHYPIPRYHAANQLIGPSELGFGGDLLVPYEIQSVSGYGSLFQARYLRFSSVVEGGQVSALTSPSFTNYNSRLMDMLNAKYILSREPVSNPKLKLVAEGDLRVYENLGAMPRVWVAPHAEVVKQPAEALALMQSERFDPWQMVVLEQEPERHSAPALTATGSWAKVLTYSPNEVTIAATLDGSGFLILSDAYYPGWKAYVDGQETTVYQADYLLRGVYLDKGGHLVRFVYDPLSFKIGAAMTLVTIAAVVVFMGCHAYRHLRRRATSGSSDIGNQDQAID